jgi:hypothetical protein
MRIITPTGGSRVFIALVDLPIPAPPDPPLVLAIRVRKLVAQRGAASYFVMSYKCNAPPEPLRSQKFITWINSSTRHY